MLFESGGWAGEPADLLKADVNNPRGYGERRDIVRLHEEWLGSLGASWSLPPNHAALTDIDVERRDHASSLMTSVSSQVPTGRTLVLKDPRLALFVATWLEVAPAARVVLPIRHPIEVAASLWKRDQIPTAHGVALWEKYTRETLAALGERDVVVVNFTPQVIHDYRVRVPFAGKWREALNTDATLYGGGNVGNAGAVSTVVTRDSPELHIVIPPLAAIFFVPEV